MNESVFRLVNCFTAVLLIHISDYGFLDLIIDDDTSKRLLRTIFLTLAMFTIKWIS